MAMLSLSLSGMLSLSNVTNRVVLWRLVDAGTTGATLNGDILSAKSAGTVKLQATVVNEASNLRSMCICTLHLPLITENDPPPALATICYLNKNCSYTNGQKHHELHIQQCSHKPAPINCYYVGEYKNDNDSLKDAQNKLLDMYISIWNQQNNLTAEAIEKKKQQITTDIANGKILVDGCYYCMKSIHLM